MWSKTEPEAAREVAVMTTAAPLELAARTVPSTMNITSSSRVHVGPKFVSITQNVENTELVKGRILGLELVSPTKATRLRCSVAVFVCWAFVVALGLGFYLFQVAIQNTRLDIAYPLPRYVWRVIKNTTRAERLSCAAAVLALLLCTGLVVYFTVVAKQAEVNVVDRAPHEWNITREMWLARPSPNNVTQERFSPIKLVIIQHTVSPECHRFTICAAEIRNLQNYYLDASHLGWDLPYNFVIGNEGRVYQVRGWNREGAHTAGYNRCSVGIGFIGDYREDRNIHTRVTDLQLKRLKMLLQEGVDRGFLRPDYSILGAKDVASTISPGENLYRAIQAMEHYDSTDYRHRTCEQIEEMINAHD